MRTIWHQSMTELDDVPGYRPRLERHARALVGPGATIEVHGLAPGSYGDAAPSDVLGDSATYHRISRQSLDAAVRAEGEGFDAFIIGSFSEPLLAETRAAVRIPVVSITESALLASCSLGRRSLLVANAPSIAAIVNASVARHGLGARTAGAVALEPGLTEPELVGAPPAEIVDAFRARTRPLLAATGADVVVPAEAVLNEILVEAGLTEVDGARVLDSVGTAWRYAEFLIGL